MTHVKSTSQDSKGTAEGRGSQRSDNEEGANAAMLITPDTVEFPEDDQNL